MAEKSATPLVVTVSGGEAWQREALALVVGDAIRESGAEVEQTADDGMHPEMRKPYVRQVGVVRVRSRAWTEK